jgi:hypothetical protein
MARTSIALSRAQGVLATSWIASLEVSGLNYREPSKRTFDAANVRSGTLELRELSLAFSTPHDMVIVVGCSHPRIDKIVESASAINPRIRCLRSVRRFAQYERVQQGFSALRSLEMRLRIESVFEHYAVRSEYYKRANLAQRFVMEDAFYWLSMELLRKIIGPFDSWDEWYQFLVKQEHVHSSLDSRSSFDLVGSKDGSVLGMVYQQTVAPDSLLARG